MFEVIIISEFMNPEIRITSTFRCFSQAGRLTWMSFSKESTSNMDVVPTHFLKLEAEIWIFSTNFIIINNYEQQPILLLWFYDYCIDISISNLRKANFSRKFVVRNELATDDVITTNDVIHPY